MKYYFLIIAFLLSITLICNSKIAYTFYGYNTEGSTMESFGPVSFNLTNTDSLDLNYRPNWVPMIVGSGVNNEIYCLGVSWFRYFTKIDPVTKTISYIQVITEFGEYSKASINYDVTTNTMYILCDSNFYKININNGSLTYIANLHHNFYTLACNSEGDLFAGYPNSIFYIDKYTGVTAFLSNFISYDMHNDCNWEFDRDTDTLYWMRSSYETGGDFSLRKLDVNTGLSTAVGVMPRIADSAYCTGLLAIPYTPKPLSVPNLLSPANLSSGISLTPTLDWDDVPNATKYTLQASLSRDFTTPLLNIENLTVSQYIIPDSTPLNRNTQYFWRVKAFNEGGDSTSWWSTKFRFRTIGNSISGIISYNNQAGTPLTNCTLSLKDSTSTTIAQMTSDSTGFYNFNSVYHGTYTIEASTTKTWGGLNMVDASITRQKIAFLTEFTPLQNQSADVNLSNSVNMIDVALMRQKIAFLNPPQWLIPNYIFEKPTVIVNGENVTVNIKALCGGDVDGSWVPSE